VHHSRRNQAHFSRPPDNTMTGTTLMKRLLLTALIGGLSLTACAQAPQGASAGATKPAAVVVPATEADKVAEAQVRKALQTIDPKLQVDYISAAPMRGFREVIVGGQPVYVSDDGTYLIQGQVIDLAARSDVAQNSAGLKQYRANLIASVPQSQRIIFAPPNPKYTVSVFTAVDCAYCRRLHSQIAEYNKLGIAVEYMAYPRAGIGGQDYKDLVSVWCAANQKQALTDAKAGKPIAAKTCDNPVEKEYNIGVRVGVTGTPGVFTQDGVMLGGYLDPSQMRARLDQLAGSGQAGGSR
jgi:thiol:disulfide interchange protein DsbC